MGSAIGAGATAGVAWKFSKSPHGSLIIPPWFVYLIDDGSITIFRFTILFFDDSSHCRKEY